MKNVKKLAAVLVAVGVLGSAGAAYAATVRTPAEIVSELTGKTVEQINNERAAGETYGAIAEDEGKLEEFKAQMLEQKKAILDQRVKDGSLTQQQADEIYNTMKNNMANCDGTGSSQCGRGKGFGMGAGRGQGMSNGKGLGSGMGRGAGGCMR